MQEQAGDSGHQERPFRSDSICLGTTFVQEKIKIGRKVISRKSIRFNGGMRRHTVALAYRSNMIPESLLHYFNQFRSCLE